MLVVFFITYLIGTYFTVPMFAVITCCENSGKLGHLCRTCQVRNPKAGLYQVPLRSRLDCKVYINARCIHRCNRCIDLAPIVDPWLNLNFIPVVLIAYPTNIKLLVITYKLLISIYGRETVRAIDSTWTAG